MGFRLDAIKHMDRRFLLAFVSRSTLLTFKAHIVSQLKTARQVQGRENMFAVAEYWSGKYVQYLSVFGVDRIPDLDY